MPKLSLSTGNIRQTGETAKRTLRHESCLCTYCDFPTVRLLRFPHWTSGLVVKHLTSTHPGSCHTLLSDLTTRSPQEGWCKMLALTNQRLDAGFPLWNAIFCLDCEVISNSRNDKCPNCKGRSLVSLARILGGSLFAHREHRSQESALFDITITVELNRMCAKAVTTTVERFTSVLGSKLTEDQAAFHINVKPSTDRPKLQGLLVFPERDAA